VSPFKLTNVGAVVSQSQIDEFERRVGVTLPIAYRRFLLDFNGGDGAPDDSGLPAVRFLSLNWLGGPVSDADFAAFCGDPMGWADSGYERDLEWSVRAFWTSGLRAAGCLSPRSIIRISCFCDFRTALSGR